MRFDWSGFVTNSHVYSHIFKTHKCAPNPRISFVIYPRKPKKENNG